MLLVMVVVMALMFGAGGGAMGMMGTDPVAHRKALSEAESGGKVPAHEHAMPKSE